MIKKWIERAINYLEHSLVPVPMELNELDWKEDLSPNNDKLTRHLSAFANLPGGGFLVFGIDGKTGSVNGINNLSVNTIVERLSSLSRTNLTPAVTIDHSIETYNGAAILIVHILENTTKPVHLTGKSMEDAFIRSGGTTRKASRQEIASLLLNSKTPQFEELHASSLKTAAEILDILDFRSVYKLLDKPVAQNQDELLKWLKSERMIQEIDGVGYYPTNFGVLAAAYNLHDFEGLGRKSIRLIRYKGRNKVETEAEYPGSKGYAIGFEGLISFIVALLPRSEVIKNALRHETSLYPEIALRELIANALIHQDFTVKGAGPMIEIFEDRIEISNPGRLLPNKKVDRLIRTTPESRNEILAGAFRRYNICEERGSGLEKAVNAIELYGLPPLRFEELDNAFRVTMYKPKLFAELTPSERIEACYQHSILKYYSGSSLTNSSLRERFKMHEKQRPQVSIVIKEAVRQGKIKPRNPENESTKFAEYIPSWG